MPIGREKNPNINPTMVRVILNAKIIGKKYLRLCDFGDSMRKDTALTRLNAIPFENVMSGSQHLRMWKMEDLWTWAEQTMAEQIIEVRENLCYLETMQKEMEKCNLQFDSRRRL